MGNIRNLVLAFSLALVAGVAIFFGYKTLEVDENIAQAAAAIPFAALSKIYDEVERVSVRTSVGLNRNYIINSLEYFGLKWYVLLLCAVLIQFGCINLTLFYGGVIHGMLIDIGLLNSSADFPISAVVGLMILPVIFIVIYLNGRWIGSRCSKYSLIILPSSVLITIRIARIFDYIMVDAETFRQIYGEEKKLGLEYIKQSIRMSGPAVPFYFSMLLFGYWRGRRRRVYTYINHVLDIMPKSSRETLVNLAKEEAQAVLTQRA